MGDRRKAKRHAAQVRVRLRYPNVETFIEKFSINVSRGDIFIRTREPREVDALVRFEFQLQDGKPVFRGEGKVVWVKDFKPEAPNKPHGMGLKFTRLDRKSRQLIDKILKHKAEQKAKKKAAAEDEEAAEGVAASAEPVEVVEVEAAGDEAAEDEVAEDEAAEEEVAEDEAAGDEAAEDEAAEDEVAEAEADEAAGDEAEADEAEADEAEADEAEADEAEADEAEADEAEADEAEADEAEADEAEADEDEAAEDEAAADEAGEDDAAEEEAAADEVAEEEAAEEEAGEDEAAEDEAAEAEAAEDEAAEAEAAEDDAADEAAPPEAAEAESLEAEGEAVGGPFDDKAVAEIVAAVRDAVTAGQSVDEMMEMSLDVGAVIARETSDRPVDVGDVDAELAELGPEGFDTAAAVERLHGWSGEGPVPVPPSAEVVAAAAAALEEPDPDDAHFEQATEVDVEPLPPEQAAAAYAAGQATAAEAAAAAAAYEEHAVDSAPFPETAAPEEAPAAYEAEPSPGAEEPMAEAAPAGGVWDGGGGESGDLALSDDESSSPDVLFGTEEIPELLDDLLDPEDALLGSADIQPTRPPEGTSDLTLEDPAAAAALAYDEAPPTSEPETAEDVAALEYAQDPEVDSNYRGEPIVESVDVDLELDSFEAALEHQPRPSELPPPPPPEPEGGHWQDPPSLYSDDEGYAEGGETVVQMDLDATLAGGPPPGTMPPPTPPPTPSQMPSQMPPAPSDFEDRSEADDALDELMSDLKGPNELYAPESGPDLVAADELDGEDLEEQTSRLPSTQAEDLVRAMAVPTESLPDFQDPGYDESVATVAEPVAFDESGAPTQSPAPQEGAGDDGRGETKMGVPLRAPDDEGLDEATVPQDAPFDGGPTFGPGGIDPQAQPVGEVPPEGYEQVADEEGLPDESPLGDDSGKKKGFFRKLFGGGE